MSKVVGCAISLKTINNTTENSLSLDLLLPAEAYHLGDMLLLPRIARLPHGAFHNLYKFASFIKWLA